MRAFADKLIDVLQKHTLEIAEQWGRSVSTNPRTPSFHVLTREKFVPFAVEFYKNIGKLYFGERPHTAELEYFLRFAEEMHASGVPLHELIYALTLMRRHIWLYADFNVLFISTLDMHQAVESINRTILIFDYAIYGVAHRYQELAPQARRERPAVLLSPEVVTKVELSARELELLRFLLDKAEVTTRVEIHHARSRDFKNMLKEREQQVSGILEKIESALST